MTKNPILREIGQPYHDGIDEIVVVPHLPVLRLGQPYESLDVADIKRIASDQTAVRISQANPGLVRRDLLHLKEARAALAALPARRLMDITRAAGEFFFKERLPLASGKMQTPEEYVRQLSSTSGLPHALIHMNMRKLYDLMAGIEGVFAGLSRGLNPDILDSGIGEQAGVPVSYNASTHSLGVILPSNSPAVNALWIPALMMKIPVVLKPGREEPWTPWRLIQSFLKAGMPASAFGFYPTSHEGSQAIIRGCGRVMVFGDDKTVSQYASDPRVEVHGTGHSKILIGEDMADHWRDFLPTLIESVSANSGRSCINASTIVTPRHGDEIAEAIAKALLDLEPRAADHPEAKLAGFANPGFADAISAAVDSELKEPGASDVSAKLRGGSPRRVSRDGMNYLLPTITRVDSFEHPLANKEYLFPCCAVVEVPQAEMLDQIGYSLVVTAITKDKAWQQELMRSPDIDRLNLGAFPTSRVQWNQPHEGNLFEFLYKRRAIHVEA